MTRLQRISSAGLLIAAVSGAGVATGQSPDAFRVTLTPNAADRGTVVDVVVDGAKLGEAAGGAQAPTGARLVTQRGFRFDPGAVAERCIDAQACPAASKVGSGTATATVTIFGASRPVAADITAFLAAPATSGDLAGVVVDVRVPEFGQRFAATGRVLGTGGGVELRFDDVAGGGQVPAGVQFRLDRLALQVGAKRTVTVTRTRTKKVRRGGRTVKRKVRTRVKVRRDLLRTPKTCDGTWTARGVVTSADGKATTFPFQLPCRE